MTLIIRGWKLDLEKFCDFHGYEMPEDSEHFDESFPIGWKEKEGSVMIVSRIYDSIDLDNYEIYVVVDYVDLQCSSGELSGNIADKLHKLTSAHLTDVKPYKFKEYYIESETGVWVVHYNDRYNINSKCIYDR